MGIGLNGVWVVRVWFRLWWGQRMGCLWQLTRCRLAGQVRWVEPVHFTLPTLLTLLRDSTLVLPVLIHLIYK